MSSNPNFSMEEKERIAKESVRYMLLNNKAPPSVWRSFPIPRKFQQTDGSLYKPCIVSIGPYFCMQQELFLGVDKLHLLKRFLKRNSELSEEHCIEALMSLQKNAGFYYDKSSIPNGSPFQRPMVVSDLAKKNLRDPECIVLLLLLDGCFILELFYTWYDGQPDPLFKESRDQRLIFSESLLLANQIPFMVIEKLYNLVKKGPGARLPTQELHEFRTLLTKFLMNEEPTLHTSVVTAWPENIDHLLDLYHKFLICTTSLCQDENQNHYLTTFLQWIHRLIFSITPRPDQQADNRPPRQIPCATQLHERRIKFRKKQSPKNLLDVTFSRGILEIPWLQFDENKMILFSNLIALERYRERKLKWKERIVTSYIVLMDSLINTKADVEVLQRAGVFHNMLRTHKDAAVFFHQLRGSLLVDPEKHHFAKLFGKVQRYYDSSWNRSWARLRRDYCSSFWAILSVIAGLILLGLTTLQTFFTVYQYYRPHH